MKNIWSLLFIALFVGSLSAQKLASTSPERQLEIATKTLQQFEEKTTSFEEAMELGDSKKIMAVKLMIQQTMAQEIEVSKKPVHKNNRGANRTESGKAYLENKKSKAASKKLAERDLGEKQAAIYQKLSAINNVDENNSIRLHKLMLEFYDNMETGLEQKKATLNKK